MLKNMLDKFSDTHEKLFKSQILDLEDLWTAHEKF